MSDSGVQETSGTSTHPAVAAVRGALKRGDAKFQAAVFGKDENGNPNPVIDLPKRPTSKGRQTGSPPETSH